MHVPFVDLKAQYLSIKAEIDTAIHTVLEDTSFIGGPYVEAFSSSFAKTYGVEHCIPVANGTDAIYIVMKMLGIGAGDEVITVANSWISTSETISQTGARPVFVDIEPEYFTIDPSKIEEKITSRTKAIIPVHLYGHPAQMDTIMELAARYNLAVVEDCAQAHFSEYKGKRTGTFGIAGTFSFYPGKNLGAYGDAGCIITNDAALAQKCRMYANHGALVKHQHQMEGINSRLDSLQASILSAKLAHLASWTEARINNARAYAQQLHSSSLQLPKVAAETRHTFHLYVVRTKHRDQLQQYLKSKGIETAIHYPAILPLLPAYQYLGYSATDFPVAYAYQQEILSLPMYPELSQEQIAYVAEAIHAFEKNATR
jgi:dTDP-4-amino-4,6-dideoxygalactose transaminase